MVLPGTFFEYLSAFVTIVLALALTELATSLHRLMRARARVRWRVLPLVAAFFIFLTLMSDFFDLWYATWSEGISFYGLVAIMLVPLLTFLSAAAVLPDEIEPGGVDLWDHYLAERRYIWGTMLLAFVIDTATKAPKFVTDPVTQPFLFSFVTASALVFAATLLALTVRDWRLHAIALAAMLVTAQIGYSGWAIKAPNALQQPVPTPESSRAMPARPSAPGK